MRPRKRFGQNFLTDKNIIKNIVNTINPQISDHIIEIGPGKGALTDELVKFTDHLDVIEIDRDLIGLLRDKHAEQISIHEADVLDFDFSSLSQRTPFRIVGNLPYNISTPLLFKLFKLADLIQDMFFMLQLEVVERICAVPSTKDYGRLSIMSSFYTHSDKLFTVPAAAFTPQPRVTSAFIQLTPKRNTLHESARQQSARQQNVPALLNQVVTAAFSQRRKTLRNALSAFLTDDDFAALPINPKSRPENLSLDDYLNCVNHLIKKEMNIS